MPEIMRCCTQEQEQEHSPQQQPVPPINVCSRAQGMHQHGDPVIWGQQAGYKILARSIRGIVPKICLSAEQQRVVQNLRLRMSTAAHRLLPSLLTQATMQHHSQVMVFWEQPMVR